MGAALKDLVVDPPLVATPPVRPNAADTAPRYCP